MSESTRYPPRPTTPVGDAQQNPKASRTSSKDDAYFGDQKDEPERVTMDNFDTMKFHGAQLIDETDLARRVAEEAEEKQLINNLEIDQARLKKAQLNYEKAEHELREFEKSSAAHGGGKYLTELRTRVEQHGSDVLSISNRIEKHQASLKALKEGVKDNGTVLAGRLPGESEADYRIRIGLDTPFASGGGATDADRQPEHSTQHLVRPGFTASVSKPDYRKLKAFKKKSTVEESKKRDVDEYRSDSPETDHSVNARLQKRRKQSDEPVDIPPEHPRAVRRNAGRVIELTSSEEDEARPARRRGIRANDSSEDEFVPDALTTIRGSRGRASTASLTDDSAEFTESSELPKSKRAIVRKKKKDFDEDEDVADPIRLDDGDEKVYEERLKSWSTRRRAMRLKFLEENGLEEDPTYANLEEWHIPLPNVPDLVLDGGFRLPGDFHPSFFNYQKTGVQWLWQLYLRESGGILGDEMGMGKTIQICGFVGGLHYSGMLDKPVLIVAPGTLLKQWVIELHEWWPALRVSILHKSGSGMLSSRVEDEEDEDESDSAEPAKRANKKLARSIVNRVFSKGHVLLTTYEGLTTYSDLLVEEEWGYAVLDEGHKIKNPDTRVTRACKEIRTRHRIILSGTPIQNNLKELWSLFDFVLPGHLGDLPSFRESFEIPIREGGHKNADEYKIRFAQECTNILKKEIHDFLLRRLKISCLQDLPKKSEHVLICRMTDGQKQYYLNYLASEDVQAIISRKKHAFAGLSVLRAIANHPDICSSDTWQFQREGHKYGDIDYSGKLVVLMDMLKDYKKYGHRTLIFSQSVKMLDIIQSAVRTAGITFLRLDGSTPIKERSDMVHKFNGSNIDCFMLTTRTGGLGVNLTGADRVVIFDPDWNPSTDQQALQRSWRIGQQREVVVTRLLSAGTIEEKIYHRQLYKTALANKVIDPGSVTIGKGEHYDDETIRDFFTFTKTVDENGNEVDGGRIATIAGVGNLTGSRYRRDLMKQATKELEDGAGAGASVVRRDDITISSDSQSGSVQNGKENNPEAKFIKQIFSSDSQEGSIVKIPKATVTHAGSNGMTYGLEQYIEDQVAARVADLKRKRKIAQEIAVGEQISWTGKYGDIGKPKPTLRIKDKRPIRTQLLEFMRKEKYKGAVPIDDILQWCRDRNIVEKGSEEQRQVKAAVNELSIRDPGSSRTRLLKEKFGGPGKVVSEIDKRKTKAAKK